MPIKNVAQIHDSLQSLCPEGIGIAFSLDWLRNRFIDALQKMGSGAHPGLNEQIPLPASTRVQAAFRIDAAHDFDFDVLHQTLSLTLKVWLHVAKQPANKIIAFEYTISNAPVSVQVDPATLQVVLEPKNVTSVDPTSQTYDPQASANLIAAGYRTADGQADKATFEQELLYPFLWLNAQGLVRAVFRSLTVPDLLDHLRVIRPVIPLRTEVDGEYLLVWSDKALVDLGLCGTQPSPTGAPHDLNWQLHPGSPSPSSPIDTLSPSFALYFSAATLLDWHSSFLMPAVMISHTEGGFIGWRYDAAVGLKSLTVDLVPAANGGSIEAIAQLAVLGTASAWLNGPCGIKVGLINGTLTGSAFANATFKAFWDQPSLQLRAGIDVTAGVDKNSVHLDVGGLLESVFRPLVDLLEAVGVINITAQYRQHSESTLLDLSGLLSRWRPSLRVGTASALISCSSADGRTVDVSND